MSSIASESPSYGAQNIEKLSPADKSDRFSRRLNKYRIHQSDCQVKNEFVSEDQREKESRHVKELQTKKVDEVRPKRVARRKSAKINNVVEQIFQCQDLINKNKKYFRVFNSRHPKLSAISPT